MNKGKVVVISGPSGVGKHTIFEQILKFSDLNLSYSVSMTTRKSRDGEANGVDYFFVTNNEFEKAIANDELIEWAEFCGNKYGTPKKNLIDQINNGKNVALEIEVIGANNIFKMIPCDELISIFILPPSIEELKQRLINRGTESNETINNRIDRAKEELEQKNNYQYIVINDNLEKCINEVYNIIKNNI